MTTKSKFQLSKSLDERLKKFIECPEECDQAFADVTGAFILGFNFGNVSNYCGITTDYKLHNGNSVVNGRAYFKTIPDEQQIKADSDPVSEFFYSSADGLGGNSKLDKNEHLYLIVYKDGETKQAAKKIFDLNAGVFVSEQPSVTILDDAKIYSHSAMVKLNACFKLELLDGANKLQSKDKLDSVIEDAKTALSSGKGLKLHLAKSSFSTSTPLNDKATLESLYSHLDVPDEVLQAGDYLPQMTKEDKKKLVTKWRNKVKDQRFPFEIDLEHDDLSLDSTEQVPANIYKLVVEEYLYLHVNDPIAKGTRYIIMLLRQKLDHIKRLLSNRANIEEAEIKLCTFKPTLLNHLVPAVYLLPQNSKPNHEQLAKCREEIHLSYLLPLDKPAVRYSQRVLDVNIRSSDEQRGYLCNVHLDIKDKSGLKGGSKSIIGGTYTYHHYLQDKMHDSGWGCAYRSLQTIISWFKHQGHICSPDVELRVPASAKLDDSTKPLREKLHQEGRVPTHEEIQQVLVDVGDKTKTFVGSQNWVGSQEVCYVLNYLFDLDSKFISVSSGGDLVYKARDLGQHFALQSTPVMIGGGVLAHTIIGLDFNEKSGDISYLILDPHYTGSEDLSAILKKGWCGWKKNAFWDKNAFYNLCLPQRPIEF